MQNLSRVRPRFQLAQEMAQALGRGQALQRALPPATALTRRRRYAPRDYCPGRSGV